MAAHWTWVNKSVDSNHTLATNALIIAFDLQVGVFLKTDIALSPLVLCFHGPGRNDGKVLPGVVWPSGVGIFKGLLMMVLVLSGRHCSDIPLQSFQHPIGLILGSR